MMTVNLSPAEFGAWIKLLCPLAVPGKFSLGLLAPLVCMALAFWNQADKKAASFPNLEEPEGELFPGKTPGRGPQRDSARALLAGLGAEDAVVRAKAARALGECKDPQAVDPLIQALTDPQRDVRFWAAWALGAIKDPRSAAPLIAALQDADAEVRYRVAEALGELKAPQSEDALSLALNDPGEAVRQVAAWALQQIRDRKTAAEPCSIYYEMATAVTPDLVVADPQLTPTDQAKATGEAGELKKKSSMMVPPPGEEAAKGPMPLRLRQHRKNPASRRAQPCPLRAQSARKARRRLRCN